MHSVQDVSLDPETRRAWKGDDEITFSRKEFDLVLALISRPGEIVTREQLMREVWHTSFWTSSKTIDVHLGWVRRKIGDNPRRPHLITTIRGKGLRFEPQPPPGHPAAGAEGAQPVAPIVIDADVATDCADGPAAPGVGAPEMAYRAPEADRVSAAERPVVA
ncbi:winged helix-turn-helix domain-containing protein [Nocardioides sp. Leaf307]|uniref:winged helix-turn-helix domain-containing protein n=1 Tax=Nocardioides sp. Leaf307 TaxID=1736331 RepID=UPI0009EBFD54|nr:winged helix-turn-helix domain-containing protein [Nocardioides sp. Leaf307]